LNQFAFRKEFGLLPRIYLFDDALKLAVRRDLPELHYKSSSHDKLRIRVPWPHARGDFVELM
jgi:hypothetical protein